MWNAVTFHITITIMKRGMKMTKDIVHFTLFESNIAQYIKSRKFLHKYLCFCGQYFIADKHEITRGNKTNCGCLTRILNTEKHVTHGKSRTRLFGIWRSMKKRCFLPSHEAYYRYGGRGIMVCKEWLIFDNFSVWAVRNGYKEHLTLDRINNDLGYYPDNCRWATYEEQNQNKKNNTINAGIARLIVYLVYSGLSHTEVARIFEVSRPTVSFIICGKTWVNHTSKILKL